LWNTKATSDSLVADGASSLTYTVDGATAGSSASNVYWTGAPSCGQSGSVTIKKSLGKDKKKSFTYSAKDQTGYEYFKGTLEFTANTCTSYELQY
jgi:hypothetical protein